MKFYIETKINKKLYCLNIIEDNWYSVSNMLPKYNFLTKVLYIGVVNNSYKLKPVWFGKYLLWLCRLLFPSHLNRNQIIYKFLELKNKHKKEISSLKKELEKEKSKWKNCWFDWK